MIKTINVFLIQLLITSTAYSAPPIEIPFWSQIGTVKHSDLNHQTLLKRSREMSQLSISDFWETKTVKDIEEEAITLLNKLHLRDNYFPNPKENRIRIDQICCRFQFCGADGYESPSWYILVGLSAYGNEQGSGPELYFTLVYLPGRGFLSPTVNPL